MTTLETWIEDNVTVAVTDAQGVYAPQVFASNYHRHNIDAETWECILTGPDHPEYWEAWTDVERDWESPEGETIFHNGDILLVQNGDTAPDGWTDLLC